MALGREREDTAEASEAEVAGDELGRRGFKGPPGTASLHTITTDIHNQLTSNVLSDKFVIS